MKAIPKYALDLLLENLSIELEENQFQELLSLVQNFTLYNRGIKVFSIPPPLLSRPHNSLVNNWLIVLAVSANHVNPEDRPSGLVGLCK